MRSGYQIRDQNAIHFITFAVIQWVDLFTRDIYRDILIESLRYCQNEKGLILHAWAIMTNHVHFILSAKEGYALSDILRDFKKYTSLRLIKSIQQNDSESRKEWMLQIMRNSGKKNSRNTNYQVWRQYNHPIELSTNKMKDQRLSYLHNNPVKAGFVGSPEHYLYCSARAYHMGGDNMLELDFIN